MLVRNILDLCGNPAFFLLLRMCSTLAPIAIPCYTRLGHLQRAVEALQANSIAVQSEVFFFSDAPRPGHEEEVQAVRDFLSTVTGFRCVEIVKRSQNGCYQNVIGSMSQLAGDFGRVIFMEDDIITAPGFLRFMNDALDFYQDDERVLSVSGYCAPLDWRSATDVFAMARFCAWGAGITKRNFERLAQVPSGAMESIDRARLVRRGRDLDKMIRLQAQGRIQAMDVNAMYHQYLHDRLTIYPRKSLVQNIGNDGSGVHCAPTDRFWHESLWDKTDGFVFDPQPLEDEANLAMHRRFRDNRPWIRRWFRRY